MINRLLYILLVLFTVDSFSQAIKVDTSIPVSDLVTKVLVSSPCIQATNIKWSTGTSFGTNGIGYFESKNPNFPIQKGVVLSTGNALDAIGPNTGNQSAGNAAWAGDIDLENTMASAGIPMVSTNATVLEFDFIPITPNFSFDFLFASEEYGNSQCNYSDAFAYLLTNSVTGVTTNLAVVPSTNLPISVFTVRDNAFNSTCPSANSQYFDNYYGGALASTAATNFNGNTVKMTASAVLTPNVSYHIKLVIADRLNSDFDSAIFLSSQSFNIGVDVFPPDSDLTVEKKTAICFGYTAPDLDTHLSPAEYTFKWTKDGKDLPGETGPTLGGITAGKYTVTFTNFINVCAPITNDILIESYPLIKSGNPINLVKCNSGNSSYDYDLEINTPIILTGSGSPTIPIKVTYHALKSDAEDGINPLTSSYKSPDGVTIYARIENQITNCHSVKSFQLITTPSPIAYKPTDIKQCISSTTPTSISFDLSSKKEEILKNQSPVYNIVSFYDSQNKADLGIDPLNPKSFNSAGATVYVRVQNRDDHNCFSTTSFKVMTVPIPVLDFLKPVFACDSYTLQPLVVGNYYDGPKGTGKQYKAGDVIDLKSIDPESTVKKLYIYLPTDLCTPVPENTFEITFVDLPKITPLSGTFCSIPGYSLPALPYGEYYTQPDGPNGLGTKITESFIKTSQKIYTYFQSLDDPTCITFSDFDVTISESPIIPGNFINVFDCKSYTLPPLSVGKYFNGPNGTGGEITSRTITETQTVYVYTETTNGSTICSDSKEFTVHIGPDFTIPKNISACQNATLPPLQVGEYHDARGGLGNIIAAGTVIDATTQLYIYVPATTCPSLDIPFTVTITLPKIVNPNDTNPHCGSYTLQPLTIGKYFTGYRGTGIQYFAGDIITKTTNLYIYNKVVGCEDNRIAFTVTINKIPIVDNRSDILDLCADSYTLTPMSAGSVGNYYTGSGGTIELLRAGDKVTSTQKIYIYATTNSVPPCPVENYFTISFLPRVDVSNQPQVVCEKYILPTLAYGDYYTGSDATGTMLHAGDEITETQKIYVYGYFSDRNKTCISQKDFTVKIAKPILNVPPSPRTICDNDGINDGITTISSTTLTEDVLKGLPFPPSQYNVKYYDFSSDATEGKNPITLLRTQRVYFKINDIDFPTCFSAVGDIPVTVSKIPEPKPLGGFICTNKNIPFTIETALPTNNLTFEWFNNKATSLMPLETGNSLSVNLPDTYGVRATDNTTNCPSKLIAVQVINSSAPTSLDFTVTEAFSENQIVSIITTGDGGDFEYQLDFGPFQDSPRFENIIAGNHTITVRDKNGCGELANEINLINYPKYFTPNSDGIHDNWNIIDIQNKLNDAYVYIFDRHGKLLKQIITSGDGWDGTYNGHPLPADDYWFKLSYEESGHTKELKSHFALKR